ncbi:acyclic terpene utilization AtuA family protein [Cupriavidus consociatus]|uniref:acyclic terpene utilization AtuA family protein n=1 Tax=Cupriavidus consociatus TaxID=2821357 RepID=UPI001AE79B1D|nr:MULTISPECIES: acyclic terpene utilization AtuA family protein [unclassified Cupriavidus]MBP0623239.1 acyclic terpene utilization AtuA family protein [Cupriavidus sp. LEh25]MDK2659932.1 acyclic terpene utilization AtuA family protein [Cupriavidus sp. LEh21]
MQSLQIICPNGHLGFAPLRTGSFELGVAARPDYIAADSGSDDVGPVPLGSDTSTSPEAWQRHDLEHMLLASRRLGVPMIIGSAGDTGTNSRVDLYVSIIRELAQRHGLKRFRIGYFYSEVPTSLVREKLGAGETIRGLDGFADLTLSELDSTERIVAMAGVHPYLELLRQGADVIIGGRSSDAAVFAAPALHHGFAADHAYYLGKVLECASFCAEPYGGKETVLGEITRDDVRVTAMHPDQRCTVASVAGHAMYERSNPFEEFVAGGRLDMRHCRYEQLDPRTTRITGSRFEPDQLVRVKLEGAGKVGERYVGLCGIRDPYTIANVDRVIAWARDQVRARFGDNGYELHYNVYGRDGVMGELEPLRDRPGHELCVMVQGVAPTREMAEEVAMIGLRQMFYARLPDVKGTAGSVSFPLDEVLRASPAYRWTLNHTMAVHDPLALFPTHVVEAGV